MSERDELRLAYEAIYLTELRGQIDRDERNKRVVALRLAPFAIGFSFEERDAIANEALKNVAEIIDEVDFSPSGGRWQ